jgi:hypothetical protein
LVECADASGDGEGFCGGRVADVGFAPCSQRVAILRVKGDVLGVCEDCAPRGFLASDGDVDVPARDIALAAGRRVAVVDGVWIDEEVRHIELDVEVGDVALFGLVVAVPVGLGVSAVEAEGIGWWVGGLGEDKGLEGLDGAAVGWVVRYDGCVVAGGVGIGDGGVVVEAEACEMVGLCGEEGTYEMAFPLRVGTSGRSVYDGRSSSANSVKLREEELGPASSWVGSSL